LRCGLRAGLRQRGLAHQKSDSSKERAGHQARMLLRARCCRRPARSGGRMMHYCCGEGW
jgi:hypothetical protein